MVVKTKLPNHFIIYGFVKTLLRVEEREAHRVKLVGLISNAVVTIPQERRDTVQCQSQKAEQNLLVCVKREQ